MTSSERLEHEVTGNASSGVLLVFLQGWPDQMDMWEHYMDASRTFGKYKLLKINMPNAGNERIAWGQDFELLSERIKATVDSVEGVSRRILVSHDWGCIYGYVLDHVPTIIMAAPPKVFRADDSDGRTSLHTAHVTRKDHDDDLPDYPYHRVPGSEATEAKHWRCNHPIRGKGVRLQPSIPNQC